MIEYVNRPTTLRFCGYGIAIIVELRYSNCIEGNMRPIFDGRNKLLEILREKKIGQSV